MSNITNHLSGGKLPSGIVPEMEDDALKLLIAYKITPYDVLQLCGGLPAAGMSLTQFEIQAKSRHTIKVEILSNLYYLERTIDFAQRIISNDLMHVFIEGDQTGTTLFLFQVQYARKKKFKELRTRAQSRESETGVKNVEWDGYYRWARLGYQMYDPDDIHRFNQLMEQEGKPGQTLSELVLSLNDDEGYDLWIKKAEKFSWAGKFELHDGSVSMEHLRRYLKKKAINNYIP